MLLHDTNVKSSTVTYMQVSYSTFLFFYIYFAQYVYGLLGPL